MCVASWKIEFRLDPRPPFYYTLQVFLRVHVDSQPPVELSFALRVKSLLWPLALGYHTNSPWFTKHAAASGKKRARVGGLLCVFPLLRSAYGGEVRCCELGGLRWPPPPARLLSGTPGSAGEGAGKRCTERF